MVADKVELKVHFAFDDEANVWYVAASDIPGLSLEAESPEALLRRVLDCAPELIELNCDQMEQLADIAPHEHAHPSPQRPPVSVLPVFDNGYALACA